MSLVGWWPLHTENGDAPDLSGNGNNGSLSGSPTRGVAGKAGLQATDFDGSDDYIDMGASPMDGLDSFTVVAWVKPKSISSTSPLHGGTGYHIIAAQSASGDDTFELALGNDDEIYAYIDQGSNNSITTTSSPMTVGEWQMVVCRYDNSGLEIIHNNNVEESTSVSGSLINGGINFRLGDHGDTGAQYDGLLTDVRLYNRALSSWEIHQLYNWGNRDLAQPLGSSDSGAVSRWKFDGDVTDSWGSNDGTDNTSAGFVTGVKDGSSNAKRFDGSDDDVTVSGFPQISDTDSFTFAYWIYQDGDSDGYHIDGRDASNSDKGYAFFYNTSDTNRLGFTIDHGGGTTKLNADVSSGAWHFIAGTYDGSDMKLYVNGGLRAGPTSAGSSWTSDDTLIIGDSDNFSGWNLDGDIDDVRYYSRALEPWEIFQLYRWGTKGQDMRKLTVNARG